MQKKYNVISLFSGAGGLDYGFKLSGYNIIDSAEFNKKAVETHNYNFNLNSNIVDLNNDIHYLNFINNNKSKKINLLIGGFPCQGFSLAGKRNIDDPRNQLYKKVVSCLKDLNIEYFLLENVPGILSMNNGKVFAEIQNYFKENNLFFRYKIVDSSDFDVPQIRKRVIFIGTNNKKNLSKIDEIFLSLSNIKFPKKTVYDAIADLENKNEDINSNHIFTKHQKNTILKISALKEGESLYKNYSDGWKKIFYNKPSPTVKENHGGVHIHPVNNRVLTPRELARLQTFPDDFKFFGSKKDQLVQIGNAVPVNLSKLISENLKIIFDKNT